MTSRAYFYLTRAHRRQILIARRHLRRGDSLALAAQASGLSRSELDRALWLYFGERIEDPRRI